MNNIKNSSGKVIGYTDITDNCIIINNNSKPFFKITNDFLIQAVKNKNRSSEILIELYDKYYLSCGEIASLYGVCYSNINKELKKLPLKTSPKSGRRNRAYGKRQSEKTKQKISSSLVNFYTTHTQIPYERTPEIREKISKGLKEYYKNNPQNPQPHIDNWKKGVYAKVDFHHGIGGNFYSIKNQQIFYFRSLLELYYMISLEENKEVFNYIYEPFHINCDNGHTYTPDILINNYLVVELKSKRYIEKLGNDVKQNFEYKKLQGEKYCSHHKMEYKVIFDEDIGFDSARFKRHLHNNPEIVSRYQINFNSPDRMVIK